MNPYVFIVGCPRSGTTLLQRIVNAHSRIAIIHETHWVWTFFKSRTGMTDDGWVTKEMVFRLANHARFVELQMTPQQIEKLIPPDRPVRYAEFVTAVFDLYGRGRGKELVGDKTPRYARDIALFHRLWPEAKFIHLIRDGRDVCLSAIDWEETPELMLYPTWIEDPVGTAALWWEMYVRRARESGASLPGLYYEVRYESLVTQPEQECSAICASLGLAFEESMLKWPITPGLRNWREQMSPVELARFEAVAGDLLDEIGYERADRKSARTNGIPVAELRERFARYVHSLGHEIPIKWEALITKKSAVEPKKEEIVRIRG